MPDKIGLIKQLEDYMMFIPGGATGQLLRACYKMIKHQGNELEELREANTELERINGALTASETLRIEQLKIADGKLKPRKSVKRAKKA